MDRDKAIRQLKEYARGIAGGLIFGLPILYTQEVWQQGFIISAERLAIFLVFQFFVLLGYVYFAGFRKEYTFSGLAFEAVETLGLAFIVSAVILLAIAQLTTEASLEEILGKIMLATIPVSVGVAVSTVQLGTETEEEKRKKEEKATPGTFGQFVVALLGAVFFSFTFASTEEMTLIGIEAEWWHAIVLILLSLTITYGMVFYANFKGTHGAREAEKILETPSGETIAAYALSLIVAVFILFMVGRVSFNDSITTITYQTVVLGLPTSIGAAAGRLLV